MKITFHTFTMGDVDDVDIHVAHPIGQWQTSEQGRWVMENAHNVVFLTRPDEALWGHRVDIRGEINNPQKITEYYLRWPKQDAS